MLEGPKDLNRLLITIKEKSRENPDDLSLIQRLARLHLKNRNFELAAEAFERIIKIDPNHIASYVELAMCRIQQKSFDDAQYLLERANELKPGEYHIFVGLARLYEKKGETDQQVAFMMRAANAAPEKFEIRLALGETLKRHGDLTGAIEQYKIALEKHPDLEAALFALGTLFMLREDNSEAIDCFRKILKSNHGALDAHFNLANCYFRQKKFVAAIDHFKTAMRKPALFDRSTYLMAQSYFRLNDFDQAIVQMEKLTQADETNIAYLKSLAEIYEAAAEHDFAREAYQHLTMIAPDRPEFILGQIRMLVELGELQKAQKKLITLFKLHPGHIKGHKILGDIYSRQHDFKAALEEYKRTLMVSEHYAEVYVCMAEVYRQIDDEHKEHQYLSKAAELGIEEPQVLLRLGQLEQTLKLPTSMDRFKKLAQLDPGSDFAREAEYYLRHQAA